MIKIGETEILDIYHDGGYSITPIDIVKLSNGTVIWEREKINPVVNIYFNGQADIGDWEFFKPEASISYSPESGYSNESCTATIAISKIRYGYYAELEPSNLNVTVTISRYKDGYLDFSKEFHRDTGWIENETYTDSIVSPFENIHNYSYVIYIYVEAVY